MEYFAMDDHYEIPLGCLLDKEITNMFFGGRCISASERALASARVMGTALGSGYAAGTAAAYVSRGRSISEAVQFLRETELQ